MDFNFSQFLQRAAMPNQFRHTSLGLIALACSGCSSLMFGMSIASEGATRMREERAAISDDQAMAAGGNINAQIALARRYLDGPFGHPIDYSKAVDMLDKAAKGGDAGATVALASALLDGPAGDQERGIQLMQTMASQACNFTHPRSYSIRPTHSLYVYYTNRGSDQALIWNAREAVHCSDKSYGYYITQIFDRDPVKRDTERYAFFLLADLAPPLNDLAHADIVQATQRAEDLRAMVRASEAQWPAPPRQ